MFTRKFFLIALLITIFNTCARAQNNPYQEYSSLNILKEDVASEGNYFYILRKDLDVFFAISDTIGIPLYEEKSKSSSLHFQVHSNGNLSFFDQDQNSFVLLNNRLEEVDTISMADGKVADFHEFHIDEYGTRWLISYDKRIVDMSSIVDGGDKSATVSGLVIQQIDANDQLLFEWDAWDYFDVRGTYVSMLVSSIDYVHCNSLQRDTDTTIVISSRNLSEITKIDIRDGHIIWRLGGKYNEFSFIGDPKSGFSGQHTATILGDTILTLFDNGFFDNYPYSRGIKYRLNVNNRSVELLSEYIPQPYIKSSIMGSFQQLNSESSFIYWGFNKGDLIGSISEFNKFDDEVFKAVMDGGSASYRIYKSDWTPEVLVPDKNSISFNHDNLDQIELQNIHITNQGSQKLTLNTAWSPGGYFKTLTSLPVEIMPGNSIEIEVGFYPDSIGQFSEIMYFSHLTDTLIHTARVKMQGEASVLQNHENIKTELLKLYPNPVKNTINIDSHQSMGGKPVVIFDVYGRKCYEGKLDGSVLNVSDLISGFYYLNISYNNFNIIKTFVKK